MIQLKVVSELETEVAITEITKLMEIDSFQSACQEVTVTRYEGKPTCGGTYARGSNTKLSHFLFWSQGSGK